MAGREFGHLTQMPILPGLGIKMLHHHDHDHDDDDHDDHDAAAADDDKYIDSKGSLFQPAMLAYQGVYPYVAYFPLPAVLVYQRVVYLSEVSHRFHRFWN